jgi:2-desacetyl-2-hydroxyethyl bacteriochlorophyllide A dehydrogenase
MKVLTLTTPGKFDLGESAAPTKAEPGMAIVRVHRVGICGTDLHAFGGKQPFFTYPRILGHELAVEIVELGDRESPLKVGDRCSVEPYVNCGTCIACRRGKPNCCAKMSVIGVHQDGGMREYFAVPLRKLHPANALNVDQIALVETLAIGAHAVARAGIEAEENVLVIGAGPIGLSVMQFARATGRVMAMDVDARRLAFCREKVGIADTIQLDRENPATMVESLKALTHGDMPTVVIDATGNPGSMSGALRFLANGGRLVFVGLCQADISFNDPEFHRRETTLMGSRNALPADFRNIIRAIENKQLDTGMWITHRTSLQNAAEAFLEWTTPASGVLKAMIEM